ncbi:sulfatase-like hydrolase/transferase [Tepidamorphus sp. 3E244]|uniref:sulfatase-like hydrolase/transferase n=1 Tax=Tepidamorphus sp. 3E244 TaxID=3385498 RepID=UPI0038FC5421
MIALSRAVATVRAAPWLALSSLAVASGIAHLLRYHFDFSDRFAVALAIVQFAALFVACLFLRRGEQRMGWPVLSALALVLIGVWYHFRTEYGWFDWPAIWFHLIAGLDSSDGVYEQVRMTGNTLLGFGLIILGLFGISGRIGMGLRGDILLGVAFLAINPAVWHLARSFAPVDPESRVALSRLYIEPALARPRGAPRNLLHIYLESTERTFADNPRFSEAMAPLWALEARGVLATGMRQIAHTRWSVAGIAASSCGVPLFPVGYRSINGRFRLDSFLPGATCLGDILARAGYDLTFILGSDQAFGGIDKLNLDHGFRRVLDDTDILHLYPEAASIWGVDDGAVLQMALRVLRASQGGDPFGIVLETIGGHEPDGVMSQACLGSESEASGEKSGIIGAIGCTNRLVARMLETAQAEGLLDNTVVVLQSDHVSLDRTLFADLSIGERRLFFTMFGEELPVRVVTRPSSPVDVLPTLLEALGFVPENGRAGLGVSLFRDTPTLVEQHGFDGFNHLILADQTLAPALWGH